MAKLDYRVKYAYPPSDRNPDGSSGTVMRAEEAGADQEAREIAVRGGTAEVWHVHRETGERTHLRTFSPAGVPDDITPGDPLAVVSDDQVAQGINGHTDEPDYEPVTDAPLLSFQRPPQADPTNAEQPSADHDVTAALHRLGARTATVHAAGTLAPEPYVMLSLDDMAKILNRLPKGTW